MSGLTLTSARVAAEPLAAVGRVWNNLQATERGYVWTNKLGPAYIFALITLVKLWYLVQLLLPQAASASGTHSLVILHQATSVLFFALITTFFMLRSRPIRRVEGPLQAIVALIGTYIVVPIGLTPPNAQQPGTLIMADTLVTIGAAGAAFSLICLGRCFGVFPEARGLVTRGSYRFVRHPMYLFELTAMFGVLLAAWTMANVIFFLVHATMQLARMRFEERALKATFPLSYAAYARRTARLIPGLY